MKHEHKVCKHDVAYCKLCDEVYCEKCNVTWEASCTRNHWDNHWTYTDSPASVTATVTGNDDIHVYNSHTGHTSDVLS